MRGSPLAGAFPGALSWGSFLGLFLGSHLYACSRHHDETLMSSSQCLELSMIQLGPHQGLLSTSLRRFPILAYYDVDAKMMT
jgi:hypothetical protein